jgi:hypothetical protein
MKGIVKLKGVNMIVKIEDLHDQVTFKLFSILQDYTDTYNQIILNVDKKSIEYFCKNQFHRGKIANMQNFINAYQKRWKALHRINYVNFDNKTIESCRLYSDSRKHTCLNKSGFNLYIFKINILDIDKSQIFFYRSMIFKYYVDAKKDPRNIIN